MQDPSYDAISKFTAMQMHCSHIYALVQNPDKIPYVITFCAANVLHHTKSLCYPPQLPHLLFNRLPPTC